MKGSITGKGTIFSELCLFLLFSFSKGIKRASHKQYLFILLTLSYSIPPHSPTSIFKCKVSSMLLWRKLFQNHTSPFLSCFRYISEPCSWIDIHFKNNSIADWSADLVTQTTACSCMVSLLLVCLCLNPAASSLTVIIDRLSSATGHKITKEAKYEQLVKEVLRKDINKCPLPKYCSVGGTLSKAR